jgi:dTMP kinase
MGSRTGFFVTLEGGEGSGKTTQSRRIAAFLRARGHEVLETREPGGTEAGEIIRDLLLRRVEHLFPRTELALYLAARAQLVAEVIRPALVRGVSVICDRFGDSSTAYQGGGRDLGMEFVERMNDWATDGLVPDLTLGFDVSPEKGLARRGGRGGGGESLDRIEREALAFHERVREAYAEIAARHAERFRRIPADGGEEEVWERVQSMLAAQLERWEAGA